MTDTPRPRITRRTKYTLVVLILIVWTFLAGQWTDKGCDYIPQSYGLVLTHGTPDHDEGCEPEPGGPEYTDQYYG
jgi:hypothetical protein